MEKEATSSTRTKLTFKQLSIALFKALHGFELPMLFVKTGIILLLIFIGFFNQAFFIAAFLFASFFIAIEWDINSLYMLFFLLPFMNAFNISCNWNISYWAILVVFFTAINSAKYVFNLLTKKQKLNVPLFVFFLIMAIYFSIPFSGTFIAINVLESYVWIAFFFLIFSFKSRIAVKQILLLFIFGILISALIALFKDKITYLASTIPTYYAFNIKRFSGLLINPNVFYQLCLVSMFALVVVVLQGKINKWYLLLFAPLLALGWATLSKAFLITYIVTFLVLIIGLLVFRKKNQNSMFILLVAIISTILVGLILFNFSKTYFNRFENPGTPLNNEQSAGSNEGGYEQPAGSAGANEGGYEQPAGEENSIGQLSGRVQIWYQYIQNMEGDALLFGRGINSASELGPNTHNTYLQVVYEIGIVGTLLLTGNVIFLLVKFKVPLKVNFVKLSFLILLPIAIYTLAENFFLSQIGNFLIVLSAMCIISHDEYKKNLELQPKPEEKQIVKIKRKIK